MATPQRDDAGETYRKERKRLLGFIQRRVPDPEEAEDVLQEVFYQLMEAYSLTQPIERVSSWLFQVARNKIADLFRRRESKPTERLQPEGEDAAAEERVLPRWIPLASGGPEEELLREGTWEAILKALDELPEAQRWVFVQHELEGRPFKELVAETGESLNTLLARKRYAVLYLREALQQWYNDWFND